MLEAQISIADETQRRTTAREKALKEKEERLHLAESLARRATLRRQEENIAARRMTLRKQEEDVSARLTKLRENEKDLSSRMKNLEKTEESVSWQTTIWKEKEKDISWRIATMEGKEEEISARITIVDKREESILGRITDLEKREQELNRRNDVMTKLSANTGAKMLELNQRHTEIETKRKVVEDLESRERQLSDQIENHLQTAIESARVVAQNKVDVVRQDLVNANRRLEREIERSDELRKELFEAQNESSETSKENLSLRNEIDRLNDSAGELGNVNGSLQHDLKTTRQNLHISEKELTDAAFQLQSKTAENASLTTYLNSTTNRLESKQQALNASQHEIELLKQQVKGLYVQAEKADRLSAETEAQEKEIGQLREMIIEKQKELALGNLMLDDTRDTLETEQRRRRHFESYIRGETGLEGRVFAPLIRSRAVMKAIDPGPEKTPFSTYFRRNRPPNLQRNCVCRLYQLPKVRVVPSMTCQLGG